MARSQTIDTRHLVGSASQRQEPREDHVYAVNICDLTELRGFNSVSLVGLLLHDFIPAYNQDTVVINRNRMDTDAMILNGPAANDLERVEALIAFLQTSLGPRQLHRRIRCYWRGPRGGWSEVRP